MTPTPHIPGAEIADARLREIIDGCVGVTLGELPMPDRSSYRYVQDADAVFERDSRAAAHIARLDPATVKAMATELLELRESLAARIVQEGVTHRHVKRGSTYTLLGYGEMQADNWQVSRDGIDQSIDMEKVAIYRSTKDGSLWVRPVAEFEDGRFQVLAASPAANVPPQVNEAVTVKPLEWKLILPKLWGVDTALSSYRVHEHSDGKFGASLDGDSLDFICSSLDAAKAAAQADYEQRIMSALASAGASDQSGEAEPLTIVYTNWRGETAERRIVPIGMWFGSTDWHPAPQWLVKALDVDKGEERDFAWNGIDFQGDGPACASDQSRVERLETALRPFAKIFEGERDTLLIDTKHPDFRRAHQALGDRS